MMLDYFYGQSGELFSYFRIPKALFQDHRFRHLSTDARTLYGILLDRMSLSAKNGWLDEQGRVYIILAFLGILLFPARAACHKRAAFATYRRIGGLIAIIPKDWKYLRGDIYFADMEPHIGSEQGGTRPVVVLQNDVGNRYAPTLIVATVTSRTEKKRYQPTHVLIAHNTAFEKPSVVQLEQIFTIDKSRIQRFLGQTTRNEMRRIEEALMNSLEINEWDRRNADE